MKFFRKQNKSKDFSQVAEQVPVKLSTPISGHIWIAFFSFMYLAAMACSNQAIQYVSYPTQILGKSCKMVPVMAFNVFVGRKTYSLREYSHVTAITLGIVIFNLAKSHKASGESTLWGIILLFLSLGTLLLGLTLNW